MDSVTLKGLNDKIYDKRKAAALSLETVIRDAIAHNEHAKVRSIVRQLRDLANNTAPAMSNTRNGGIMGLAGASIALSQRIGPYLQIIIPPILACFSDPDHRVRYFACESMYNVAKVAKGELLVYFNEVFDAMSKLAADTDQAVRNGGELLDRLVKDIVIEQASSYVSTQSTPLDETDYPDDDVVDNKEDKRPHERTHTQASMVSAGQFSAGTATILSREGKKAFSLDRFVPLLAERMAVLNPFTRTFLVSWVTVLDAIPELELVSYLPHFLDGLIRYLGDPSEEIRYATMHVLSDFLKEIRDVAEVNRSMEEAKVAKRANIPAVKAIDRSPKQKASLRDNKAEGSSGVDPSAEDARSAATSRRQSLEVQEKPSSSLNGQQPSHSAGREQSTNALQGISEEEQRESGRTNAEHSQDGMGSDVDDEYDPDLEDAGHWIPGQGVKVDHAAIVEILLSNLSTTDEEVQAICLRWIAEFLLFVKDTMVMFTPRLIPVMLPCLAHHIPVIRQAARQTNDNLFHVVQQLPVTTQAQQSPVPSTEVSPPSVPSQPGHGRRDSASTARTNLSSTQTAPVPFPTSTQVNALAKDHGGNSLDAMVSDIHITTENGQTSQANEKYSLDGSDSTQDALDYPATVNALTLQFLNENDKTRVAALKWLSMLHWKAPRRILSLHDGTFPALLKTLSDPSEDVIRADLQLLAQISSNSEEDYFPYFITNLLSLFSTDRKLLETRGSLIIRQLCTSLNTERIYRTFAELLEKDEDLEFASIMVQNLQLIMITSPELTDFRKRLKNLETKDGQLLFTNLYRSWSHNAVAAFSLCLLAQAYEHAANLLQIFADLEVSVSLLIQIDKLVQLLESPVFTPLRLQLLEPEKYPSLYKCLYGLLMFLPQSSAFLTLRNRLNAVSPLGYLNAAPRAAYSAPSVSSPGSVGPRSTVRRTDEIKWQELLVHFRQVQLKHQRLRAQTSDIDVPIQPSTSAGLSISRSGASSAAGRRTGNGETMAVTQQRVASGKMGGQTPRSASGRPLSPQSQSQSQQSSSAGRGRRGTGLTRPRP